MAHRRQKETARNVPNARRSALDKAQRSRILLGVGVISVAIILVAILVRLPSGPTLLAGAPGLGEPAPDFVVEDIDGRTFQLSTRLGAPILIDFMGSRCPTCAAGMGDLGSIHSDFSPRGLVMISIDIGGSLGTEDPSVARDFMAAHGAAWPIALDKTGIGLRYGVAQPPTIYVIDPSGLVAYHNTGPTSAATLSEVLLRYL